MLKPSISIIIPVENESAVIDALLEHLSPLKEQCEIIFVDGGSSDGTVELLTSMGYEQNAGAAKGRANQMNHGASLASGDVLWFLHADCAPPPNALPQIWNILERGYSAGCFRIRFDSRQPLMVYNSLASNLRVRLRNVAFGDQGIFIKRELFEEIGGYAAIPLMEDYQLSIDVKKAGLNFGITRGKITTSARRYRENGMLRTMVLMQVLQRRFRRGEDVREIAKAYDDRS